MASTSVGARSGFGRQVLLVGGIGRMEAQYRALVESRGYELIYRERRITGGTPPATLAAAQDLHSGDEAVARAAREAWIQAGVGGVETIGESASP